MSVKYFFTVNPTEAQDTFINADSREDAALTVAKRIHGKSIRIRLAAGGEDGGPGYWQPYKGANAVGASIHVL